MRHKPQEDSELMMRSRDEFSGPNINEGDMPGIGQSTYYNLSSNDPPTTSNNRLSLMTQNNVEEGRAITAGAAS